MIPITCKNVYFVIKKISDLIDDEKMMKMFKKDILYHMFT